jgi:catechol 2,3-dioxygenase-like lactoylglutathione lyase family enzyme
MQKRAGTDHQPTAMTVTDSSRPTHAGLRHVALNVRNFEAMTDFYVELLGFGIEWAPDADNLYLSSGVDNLALHRAGPAAPSGPSALDHLGVIVRTPDAVDAWAAFLGSRGVTIAAPPRTHRDGARSCYVHDPDGNSVQIIHHPPISGKV